MDCIKVCTKKTNQLGLKVLYYETFFYNLNPDKCLLYNSLILIINHTCQAKNFFCLALFEFS